MLRWTVVVRETLKEDSVHAAIAVGCEVYSFIGTIPWTFKKHPIEVCVFDTVSLRWRKLPGVTPGRWEFPLEFPIAYCGYTAVLIGDIAYIWGGYVRVGYGYGGLHSFDMDTHSWFKPKITGTVPEGRTSHSACVLEKSMYIHGGQTSTGILFKDIYKLDTTAMVWSMINTGDTRVPASAGYSVTIIGTKMYVFGGTRQGGNNIRVFDTETNHWLSTPSAQLSPKGRWGHSAFAYNGELYIFGGKGMGSRHRDSNDLWKFNLKTFSWKEVKAKGNCPWPTMSSGFCCIVGDLILFREHSIKCDNVYILDMSPGLKTLCKLAVIQYSPFSTPTQHHVGIGSHDEK